MPSQCLFGESEPYERAWGLEPNNGAQPIQLLCGTPMKGVLHIDGSHPIPADQDNLFIWCGVNILTKLHEDVPANPGHVAIKMNRTDGQSATMVWEESTGDVITLFTSDSPQGNNWAGCAGNLSPTT